MSEPIIRLCRADDINDLCNLDKKCYQYPYSIQDWQALAPASGKENQPKVVLIEVMRRKVGFILWQYQSEDVASLLKIGILKDYRLNGLATTLLDRCVQDCRRMKIDKIIINVPAIHCCPGDPDDVSVFLNKVGFSTNGTIIPEYREMYGEFVEAYQFERIV